ncbi:MAG: CopD family protein [Proteobacteria bacterium]|nr:CopD family protein [Pseudomonadota bacterium]
MQPHLISYDLARGLHIIAVMAWVAGLLILPRYYAHISGSQRGGELEQTLLAASKKLTAIILTPSIILAWALGIFLFATYLVSDWERPLPEIAAAAPHWLLVKLIFVLGLSGYHGFLLAEGRRLAAGERRHSGRFWRIMGEVPFLVAIVVVLLATTKPDL